MPPHHNHRDRSMVSTKGKGEEPTVATWPTLSNSHLGSSGKSARRPSLSQSIFARSHTSNNPPLVERNPCDEKHSSNTWTSSSENVDLPSDEEVKDDREHFVLEYNRLAQRHGLRPLVPGDFSPQTGRANGSLNGRRDSWLSKMLRQTSEQPDQTATKPDKISLRHERSLSDVALHFVHNRKRDGLKDQDLRALVRLCGKSRLFLPTDYAPCSLTLPTCFRALAQALVQHADTKGIFRVPGSVRAINALYEYYCTDGNTDAISSTTRCPTLPTHIRCNTHDIASTFKRFLAGLPGGILGSLSLFDALVAIHSRLQGHAELHRTKESKLRARLIALAIGTVKSQYQRELICAVFGLLCLIGRIAENAPREDESGHPLPTTDLMGYNALGIVFGPLLIGDMIDDYSMKVADPSAGLVLLPVEPPRSRKERHKQKHEHNHQPKSRHKYAKKHRHAERHAQTKAPSLSVDKIHIANSITEMLIIHWREVVRQIRSTGALKSRRNVSSLPQRQEGPRNNTSSSGSENLSLKHLPHLHHARLGSISPSTVSPTPTSKVKHLSAMGDQDNAIDPCASHVRQASSISSSGSIQKCSTKATPHLLSPTIEESLPHIDASKPTHDYRKANKNGVSDVTQTTYPISLDTRPSQVHGSWSTRSVSRPKIIEEEIIAGEDTNIQRTVRSTGTRISETPPPPPSRVPQNRMLNTSHLDMALLDSSETGDTTTFKVTSSLSNKPDPPISCLDFPTVQATPRHEHDLVTPNLESPQQTIPCEDRVEMNPNNSDNAVMEKTGSGQAQATRKAVVSGKVSPLDPLLCDSGHDDGLGNKCLPQSITNPNLRRGSNFTPIESLDSGYADSSNLGKTNPGSGILGSPADQWRNLMASSRASTESLAKSAKERRLKRSSGHIPHLSQDAASLVDSRSTMPEWKQQLLKKTYESTKSTMARPERQSRLGETSQSTRPVLESPVKRCSPDKYVTNTPHREGSQRSTSKPMPGAVKAMAALFDNAAKESPDRSMVAPSGGARHRRGESDNFLCCNTLNESPTKSKPQQGARASVKSVADLDEHPHQRKPTEALTPEKYSPSHRGGLSIVRTTPSRPVVEHTPTRSSRNTLKPVKTFSSAKNEPQSLPNKPIHDTDGNQPLRLGTMVPYEEEPPVGHFVRRSSATSAHSRNMSAERAPPLDGPDPRQTSGNSSLHAQIRSLQRQLELRNEEILQLRRQLETQEHMDIGTLCEQLRLAKRECMTWRKRAETAERRVAVFQRFGSKFQALKDGAVDDDDDDDGHEHQSPARGRCRDDYGDDGSSTYSVHTESREAFNDRIRRSFAWKAQAAGGDGAVFDDYGEGSAVAGSHHRRGRSRRTVKLWAAAQELLDLQRDDDMCGLGRENAAF